MVVSKQPEFADIELFTGLAIANSQSARIEVIDTAGWGTKTIYVKTNAELTINVLGGADENNMGFLVSGDMGAGSDAEDAELVWTVDGMIKCFAIHTHLRYMSIQFNNASGQTVIASAWVSGG